MVDFIIIITLLALVTAFVVAIWSKITSVRKNKTEKVVNGIPAKKITYAVTAFTVILCLLTFFCIPVDNLVINGAEYTDTFWLRASNMCIITSLLLLLASVCAIGFGVFQNRRNNVHKTQK